MGDRRFPRRSARLRLAAISLLGATTAAGCSTDGGASSDAAEDPAAGTAADAATDAGSPPPTIASTPAGSAPGSTVSDPPTLAATTLAADTTTTVGIDWTGRYLAAIDSVNCASAALRAANVELLGDDLTFAEDEWADLRGGLQAARSDFAEAVQDAVDGLAADTWPPGLRGDIAELVAELEQVVAVSRGLSTAETMDEWVAGITAERAIEFAAASTIRAKLGLETDVALPTDCPT